MFVANAITVWVEALQQAFDSDYINPDVQNITISTDYPQRMVEFPSVWVNFIPSGDTSNVGIGHIEYVDQGENVFKEYFRWSFSGMVEFVVNSMGNLERALLIDEITKAIAIARPGENDTGSLREHVQQSDIIGMIASWESITIGAFQETVGTPWGTDDVIYEGSISLPVEGEVILDAETGEVIPLSAITVTPLGPGEGDPPVPGPGVGIGVWQ